MVCSEVVGLRCQCIVRDSDGQKVFECTYPAHEPVSSLLSNVATKLNCDVETFSLIYHQSVLDANTEGTLAEVGLSTELDTRNNLLLMHQKSNTAKARSTSTSVKHQENGQQFQDTERQLQPFQTAVGSTSAPVYQQNQTPFKARNIVIDTTDYNFRSFVPSTSSRGPTPAYVGLVNQAMTCYLNSLLQALYMTPEFRNALYKWKFESSKPAKSIPFQLQKLFLNLQTSSKSAVETTELTLSFGWGTGDVWHQHDVQELCRVMFDALEQEFKQTSQADLINQLYQGKMIDYVKCLECGMEKSREDTFLDIPLPVRPFGSTVAYGSIEEALRAFVQPEILDENNQYFCENCGKKCNAHKGLKFSQFPYLLTLHLKRFDFDYSTMHRIKLNDKVVFPELLDLSSFLMKGGDTPMDESAPEGKCDDSSTADSALDDDTSHTGATITLDTQVVDHDQEEDEGIEMSRGSVAASGSSSGSESDRLAEGVIPVNNDCADLNNEEPPVTNHISDGEHLGPSNHLYELYSIMIHSGSASGGHYYAYIKDFTINQWFCFNDQTVSKVTYEDIEKTYGGGPIRGYYSKVYSSSTNAYMLMYRLIDKERNAAPLTPDEFPPHIKKLVEQMKENEEREKALQARQEEMLKIKVFWSFNKGRNSLSQTKLILHQDTPLSEVLEQAYKNLQLESVVPIEQCRLVLFNGANHQMQCSFEGKESDPIGSFSFEAYSPEFLLEARTKDQIFTPYKPLDLRMTVYGVNFDKEEIISVDTIQVGVDANVEDLKDTLCKVFPQLRAWCSEGRELVLVDYSTLLDKPALILDYSKPLMSYFFHALSSNKLFVSPATPALQADLEGGFNNSNYLKFLEKVRNVILIHLSLPEVSDEILERLLIPPISEQKPHSNNNKPEQGAGDAPISNMTEEEALNCAAASDQSTSEDSSLTDSERTIIGEPVNEGQLSSPSDSELQLSSPEPIPTNETATNYTMSQDEEDWDVDTPCNKLPVIPQKKDFYFKATPYIMNNQKMLQVVVDKYADWSWFVGQMEAWVGVEMKYLKVSKSDGVNSLNMVSDHEHLNIKLHRPLATNECNFKIFQFQVNSTPMFRFITEWIVTKGQTVGESKKALLKYLEKRGLLVIPFNRCRLRKKNWKNVGRVLMDTDVWDDSVDELFIETLDSDEVVTSSNQAIVFVRRWHPSTFTLGPIQQVVVDIKTPSMLGQKLSEMHDIPIENLKLAKGPSAFPWELPLLSIHSSLDWEKDTHSLNTSRFSYCDDSIMVVFRDDREEVKVLTKEETDEVNQREMSRLGTSTATASPRKEKPLKIYLDKSDYYIPPPDYD